MEQTRDTTYDTLRREPLEFYVDKLKRNDYFSLARFGDGELYCLWGAKGENSNKCRYSPELRKGLEESFRHKKDKKFIYGMQHVLPRDLKMAQSMYDVDWYDSEVFGEALASGGLYPLIAQLRVMNTVVIGNKDIKADVGRIFYNTHFIEVPASNALDVKDDVLKQCRALAPACFLFSCGMAANVFIADLHGLKKSFLIDLGHIWDPFTGNMSRCDLYGKTKEEIERNLYPNV